MKERVLFMADHMLKRLSKWLRFMGYDVEYPEKGVVDNDIVEMCSINGRVLLTRDHELYSRVSRSMLIMSENFKEQVNQVISSFPPDSRLYFTRCAECNGILEEREASDPEYEVPEGVRKLQDRIWVCMKCGKVYWKGSHYEKILRQINSFDKEIQ